MTVKTFYKPSALTAIAFTLLFNMGCVNVAYRPLVEQIMGRSPSGFDEADVKKYFDQLGFAQLDLQFPGRTPSRFILMSRDNQRESWIDASGVSLVRENVFNFSSHGLADFNGEVVVGDADMRSSLNSLIQGEVESLARSRFLMVGSTLHEQALDYRYLGESIKEIDGISVTVHIIEEVVRDTGRGQWVNEHWLLLDSFYNIRSLVRMTYEQESSVIVVRKIPAVLAR